MKRCEDCKHFRMANGFAGVRNKILEATCDRHTKLSAKSFLSSQFDDDVVTVRCIDAREATGFINNQNEMACGPVAYYFKPKDESA